MKIYLLMTRFRLIWRRILLNITYNSFYRRVYFTRQEIEKYLHRFLCAVSLKSVGFYNFVNIRYHVVRKTLCLSSILTPKQTSKLFFVFWGSVLSKTFTSPKFLFVYWKKSWEQAGFWAIITKIGRLSTCIFSWNLSFFEND